MEEDEDQEYPISPTEAPPETWLWCLHCERAYPRQEARGWAAGEAIWMCAYPGCDGDLFMDARLYDTLRAEVHPEWPLVPKRDHVYPLYTEGIE